MSVLVTTVIPGLDAASYDRLASVLGPALRGAAGFRAHAAAVTDGGMEVTEVWDDSDAFHAFFDTHVAANLPPGAEPQLTELHNAIVGA